MEVAPQELAALLKLAGVGSDPEPEMVAQPQVSAIAIPSEDDRCLHLDLRQRCWVNGG